MTTIKLISIIIISLPLLSGLAFGQDLEKQYNEIQAEKEKERSNYLAERAFNDEIIHEPNQEICKLDSDSHINILTTPNDESALSHAQEFGFAYATFQKMFTSGIIISRHNNKVYFCIGCVSSFNQSYWDIIDVTHNYPNGNFSLENSSMYYGKFEFKYNEDSKSLFIKIIEDSDGALKGMSVGKLNCESKSAFLVEKNKAEKAPLELIK